MAADLQGHEPQAPVTVARGSSDHAARYMGDLVMSRLGRLVTSLPMSLVDEGYPLLFFAPRGPAQAGLLELALDMRQRGARMLLAVPAGTPGGELPLVPTGHEDLGPIAAISPATRWSSSSRGRAARTPTRRDTWPR